MAAIWGFTRLIPRGNLISNSSATCEHVLKKEKTSSLLQGERDPIGTCIGTQPCSISMYSSTLVRCMHVITAPFLCMHCAAIWQPSVNGSCRAYSDLGNSARDDYSTDYSSAQPSPAARSRSKSPGTGNSSWAAVSGKGPLSRLPSLSAVYLLRPSGDGLSPLQLSLLRAKCAYTTTHALRSTEYGKQNWTHRPSNGKSRGEKKMRTANSACC